MMSVICSDNREGIKSNPQRPGSDPYVFSESQHSTRLLAGLRYLRDSSQLFDVTLIAEEREFRAHRVVLASCSDYFHAMFTNGLKESSQHSVLLHGVGASALEQLIQFAYTSKIKITKENVVAILSSASHVQMLPVVSACETYLSSQLSLQNCTELKEIADLYSLRKLHQEVCCFMCQHWVHFVRTPEYLSLSLKHLKDILQSDFPVYCPEVEVVRGLLDWLNHDLDQRVPHLSEVLDLVRCDNLQKNDVKELLSSPVVRSIRTACPSLSAHLLKMTTGDWSEVKGVVNTRGHFQTVLVVGGFLQPTQNFIRNEIMHLDLQTGEFVPYTAIPRMKQANFGLEVLDNNLYVIGGCFAEDFTEVTHPYGYCLETSTRTWTALPPMQQERSRFYLGALNGLLYAIGGDFDNAHSLSACEMFDPATPSWFPMAPLPAARSELAGASLGGKLYVSGGTDQEVAHVCSDMWRYDPAHDRWSACAPLLTPRADHLMFTFGGHLYVIGGWDARDHAHVPVNSVDRYDADTNRWETVQRMKTARMKCSFTLFQGQIFVTGGVSHNEPVVRSMEELDVLDLKTMEWQPPTISLPHVWEHSTAAICLPRKI